MRRLGRKGLIATFCLKSIQPGAEEVARHSERNVIRRLCYRRNLPSVPMRCVLATGSKTQFCRDENINSDDAVNYFISL